MSPDRASLPPAYFDELYAADSDPWWFASSAYEQAKYDRTLSWLPRPRYPAALEIGCSIGVLTARLAAHCDHLLAIDAAAAPLEEARRRCDGQPWVSFDAMYVPERWPSRRFDLILLSEVVYYLVETDVTRLALRIEAALRPHGDILLVHWTGPTNYPLSGDAAVEAFVDASAGFARVVRQARAPEYRLDLLVRRP